MNVIFTSAILNLNLFHSWQVETMPLFFHAVFWLLLSCWGPGVLWAVQGIADLTSCSQLLHSHLLTDALLPRNYIQSFTLLQRLTPS